MSKRKKEYWNMTTDELEEATKEFDDEDVADTFRPMTPSEEAVWTSAVKEQPAGRTANGKDLKVISLGIDAELLTRVDTLAKKRRISRSRLVAEGLEVVLAKSKK